MALQGEEQGGTGCDFIHTSLPPPPPCVPAAEFSGGAAGQLHASPLLALAFLLLSGIPKATLFLQAQAQASVELGPGCAAGQYRGWTRGINLQERHAFDSGGLPAPCTAFG